MATHTKSIVISFPKVLLEWRFGLNEQHSGTIALFETAYVAGTTCDTSEENYYNACDMYWPCDHGTCTPKGMQQQPTESSKQPIKARY